MLRPAQRRLIFLSAAFALSLLSCGREITGPGNGIRYSGRFASLAIAPTMPELMSAIAGASQAVPFERVRLVLRNVDGSVAKDTVVEFPSTADSVALTLQLPIPLDAPAGGLPLSLTMAYVNAAGDTVFRAGPSAVTARPVGSEGASVPVVVPVTYDGPGKDATSVAILPKSGSAVAGTTTMFAATARDAQSAIIPNTPFLFFTLDSSRVQVNGATGLASWLPVRGTARIVAALPNGLRADTATFTVALPAAKLVLGAGDAQTGALNAPLADSIVVRTLASDDVPVEGVVVTFAVTSGGGTLSALVDTSDANGEVKTAWTLGATLGAQAISASAAGLTGSPLAITATATVGTPARLEILQQPSGSSAGSVLAPALTVIARDAFGNAVPSFADNVTVSVAGAQPVPLIGTLLQPAVAGTATFADLTFNTAGQYQLIVSSGSLTPDTTAILAIEPAAAAQLVLLTQPPTSVAAGATFAASVEVQDAFGNRVDDWASPVTVAFEQSPVGASFVSGGSADVISGEASFTDLVLDRAGRYQLRFTSETLAAALSDEFDVLSAGAEAMNAFAGDLQTAVAGSTLPTPLVVVISDNFGNPIAGVTVNWTVNSGGGSLSAPSSVTDAQGQASITWTLGGTAGDQSVTASAGFLPEVEFTATATAGAPTQLLFISQPTTAVAGEPFPPTLFLEFRDANGNRAVTYTDSITMTVDSGPPGGVLLGSTRQIIMSGGGPSGQFAGLEAEVAGTYILRATADGGLTALSAPIVVTPNGFRALLLVSGGNDTATVNQPFAAPLRVRVVDSFGNPVQGAVTTWIDQGGGAVLAADTVLTDAGGFAENTATHGPTPVALSAVTAFVVGGPDSRDFFYTTLAGAPASVVATAGDGQSGAVGTTLPLEVQVRDAGDNPVPNVPVNWTVSSGDANVTINTVFTDADGRSQVEVVLGSATGPVTVLATVDGLSPVSFTLEAVAGEAVFPNVIVAPLGGTAGTALAPFSYAVFDAFDNIATGYSGTATVTLQKANGVQPDPVILGGDTVAVVNGVATWDALVIASAGQYRIVADFGPTLGDSVSEILVIEPGAAAAAVIVSAPGSSIAGQFLSPLVVELRDAFGNIAKFANATVDVALDSALTVGTLNGTLSVLADSGVATFSDLSLLVAGPYALVVSSPGVTPDTTAQFEIVAGEGWSVEFASADSVLGVVGTALAEPLAIRVRDQFGNVVPNWSTFWTLLGGGAVLDSADVQTDAQGIARTTLTFGPEVEEFSVQASAGDAGLVVFALRTVNAPAENLLVLDNIAETTAGDTIAPIVVVVRDALLNEAVDFTGDVSVVIDNGPDGATLGGTTTVAADSGRATFADLTLDKAGSYQLRFQSAGLADALSEAFTITVGAAAQIAIVDGNAQTDTIGAVLPLPLRIRVTDAFGNPVPNVGVDWSAEDGVNLDEGPISTDANGEMAYSATLGRSAGTFGVTATIGALPDSSVTFFVTALPGDAFNLSVVSAPDTVVAGELVSLTIHAVDREGNLVTGFTGDVTIEATGGVPAPKGTVTVAAADGIAFFDAITFDTAGAYSLVARAAGDLTAGFALTVLPAPAAQLDVVSGDAQTGLTGFQLDAPVVLRLRDNFANPVANDTIFVTVESGGGVIGDLADSLALVTNSAGEVSVIWTLGDAAGTQTLSAFSATLGPITITATAEQSVANAIWTGDVSDVANDPANWRNGLVPEASDSVLVPAGRPNYPALLTSTTYGKLTIASGARFNVNTADLAVMGDVRAFGDGIVGVGGNVVAASGGVLVGTFPGLVVSGTYATTGDVTTFSTLLINSAGSLTLSTGDSLEVNGDLETVDSGSFVQLGASAAFINGEIVLAGGTSTFAGGGRLHLFGGITTTGDAPADAFLADPAHGLYLLSDANHAINFAVADITPDGACTASCLGSVYADSAGTTLTFTTDAMAMGGFLLGVDAPLGAINGNGRTVISGAPATLNAESGGRFGTLGFTDALTFSGFDADSLKAFGSGTLPPLLGIPTIIAGDFRLAGTHNSELYVDGSLDIEGSLARVEGPLATRGSGFLTMTDGDDSLVVTGELRFEGAASAGQLTAGVLDAEGNVVLGPNVAVFADSAHVLRMASGSQQRMNVADASTRLGSLLVEANTTVELIADTVKFAGDATVLGVESRVTTSGSTWAEIAGRLVDPDGDKFLAFATLTGTDAIATPQFGADSLKLRGSNTLTENLAVIGALTIESGGHLALGGNSLYVEFGLVTSGTGTLEMSNPLDSVTVLEDALFNGGPSILTQGVLRLRGRFDVGTPQGFKGEPTHTTELFNVNFQQIGFSYPGFGPLQSHFGRVVLNKEGGAPSASTAVFVNGRLETAIGSQIWTGTGAPRPLTVRGADITSLSLVDLPLRIEDGDDILRLENLVFNGFNSPDSAQLTIVRSGGNVALVSPSFDESSGSIFLSAIDTDELDNDTLTIDVSDPSPATNNGNVSTAGGARILGWGDFAAIVWTGAVDNDWLNPLNWQQGRVPTGADSVVVPFSAGSGNLPSLASDTAVRAFTFEPNDVSMTLTGVLTIRGSISGGSESPAIECQGSGALILAPADSGVMSARVGCLVTVTSGRVVAEGTTAMAGLRIEGSGEFHINDGDIVNVNGQLFTEDNGTLRMDGDFGGELRVAQDAAFRSNPVSGALTTGVIQFGGGFVQETSPRAFAPGLFLSSEFVGTASRTIFFEHPDPVNGSHFGGLSPLLFGAQLELQLLSDVYVEGVLNARAGSTQIFASQGGVTRLLRVRGLDNDTESPLEFSNLRFEIVDGESLVGELYGFRFVNFTTPGVPQLRIARENGSLSLFGFQFDSEAFDPLYLQIEDTDPVVGDELTVFLGSGTTPEFHGGAISVLGGAVLQGWDEALQFVWASVSDIDFNLASNWSGGVAPGPGDRAVIPASATVEPWLSADITIGSLVVESTSIAVQADDWNLTITDSLVAPSGTPGIACQGTAALAFAPTDTASIRGDVFCPVRVVSGALVTSGPSTFGGPTLLTGSGSFIPRHEVTIDGEEGSLLVEDGGRLLMQEPDVSLYVQGPVTFAASATSLLQQGNLYVRDSLVQTSSPSAVAGQATHTTTLFGSASSLRFDNPQDATLGSVEIGGNAVAQFQSSVRLNGGLSLLTDAQLALSGETVTRLSGQLMTALGTVTCGSQSGIQFDFRAGAGVSPIGGDLSGCPLTILGGEYAVAQRASVRDVVIGGTAVLDLNAGTLIVSDSLSTVDDGVLRMQSATDSVITRNAAFRGGTTVGQLTDGVLLVERIFTQSSQSTATSFSASGAHRTVIGDSTISNPFGLDFASSYVSFADPDFSAFNQFEIIGGWVELESPVRSQGQTALAPNTRLSGTRLTADDGFDGSQGSVVLNRLSVAGSMLPGQNFSVDTVEFRGSVGVEPDQQIPNDNGESRVSYSTILVTGPGVVMRDDARGAYELDRLEVSAGSLAIENGISILADNGSLAVTGSAILTLDSSSQTSLLFDSVFVSTAVPIDASFGALSTRSFVQQGTANFRASGSYSVTMNGVGTLSFDDPDGAYFQNLSFSAGATSTLLSDVTVNGRLSRVDSEGEVVLQSNSLDVTPPRLLRVAGGLGIPAISGGQTRLRNVGLSLSGSYSSSNDLQFNRISFERMDPTASLPYLYAQHTGSAQPTWSDISFDVTLDGALYFFWEAPNEGGQITFENAFPAVGCLASACVPGDKAPDVGGTVVWTGTVNNDWFNPGNWNAAVLPTASSDVVIQNGATFVPTAPAGAQFASLIVEEGQTLYIEQGGSITVFGDVEVTGQLIGLDDFSEIIMRPAGTAGLGTPDAGIIAARVSIDRGLGGAEGTVQLTNPVYIDSTSLARHLRVYGGTLDLNNYTLRVGGEFNTLGSGKLRMVSSLDTLYAHGDIYFMGGNTTGLLSAGVIVAYLGFNQFKSDATEATFYASGSHELRFVGPTTNEVYFESSDAASASRVNRLSIVKADGQVSMPRGNLFVEDIVGAFIGANFSLSSPTESSHLYVLGTIDSGVSSETRGFSLGEFGFVTVVKGDPDGCTPNSVRLVSGSQSNFSPSTCTFVP